MTCQRLDGGTVLVELKGGEMPWKPSHEPVRYDRARVARLKPLQDAVERLGLPPLRLRKLRVLLSAIEVQIEDGGDSPEVNALLLDALRAGVHHQVDTRTAQAVVRAIDTFAQAEEQRWAQARAGTLAPIELTPDEQLDDLMQDGYRLQQAGNICTGGHPRATSAGSITPVAALTGGGRTSAVGTASQEARPQ